jgi:hypothetical protein
VSPPGRILRARAAREERPRSDRLDSAHSFIRSALLSEAVSANVLEMIPQCNVVSCSGTGTPIQNVRAAVQCECGTWREKSHVLFREQPVWL